LNEGTQAPDNNKFNIVLNFYSISIKRVLNVKYKYGQQEYDFNEGVMFFIAPNQVFGIETGEHASKQSGWVLLIHPDFLWNTSLATTIKKYEYFDYSVNEALFLSEKEEATINNIIQHIQQEYHTNIDKFSQDIIISQIETLLNYAERFYHRQFITRKKAKLPVDQPSFPIGKNSISVAQVHFPWRQHISLWKFSVFQRQWIISGRKQAFPMSEGSSLMGNG
jgi:hypothetical protein